jgi:hypothetical protein
VISINRYIFILFMQNIIKYIVVTLTIENLILSHTVALYLSLMVGSLLFTCKLIKLISGLLWETKIP